MSLSYLAKRTLLQLARPAVRREIGVSMRAMFHANQGRPNLASAAVYDTGRVDIDALRGLSSSTGVVSNPAEHAARYRDQILVTYHDMEEALKMKGYSITRLTMFLVMGLVGIPALYWNRIKHWSQQEGAEVASKTLGDERLIMKAEDMAKSVANALLDDVETSITAKKFISEVAVKDEATAFALEVGKAIAHDPELLRESRKFFGDVFRTDPVYEAASKSGMEVVSSPEFQSKGLETIRKALYSDEFKSAGYEFVSECFSKAFAQSDTKTEAVKISNKVLQDPALRETAGEAMWAAAKIGFFGLRSTRNPTPNRRTYQAQQVTPLSS
mmetsp:Transcript_42342/g.165296  ORF Transcript_42342/g.165296 Transcript_42342/m.165296 type:complete len:328 (+) Transcript_42342:322-1305(+)